MSVLRSVGLRVGGGAVPASVTFVAGSATTVDYATEATGYTFGYTPSAVGRLFANLVVDNNNAALITIPSGWTAHRQNGEAGDVFEIYQNVLSIEITTGMVGNIQSWEFVVNNARRATLTAFMLAGVNHAALIGGTLTDSTLTDRSAAGGGNLTVGTAGSAIVTFAGSNNAGGSLSVSTTNGSTQTGLANPTTTYQPSVYAGYLLDAAAGSQAVPVVADSSATGIAVHAMEVKA